MLDAIHIASYAAGLCSSVWLATLAFATWRLWKLPNFEEQACESPSSWPSLSVVVPACNEADVLEPAMQSLLAQDYPQLEIVLVDDRSTDATPEIVDRLAATDERITPIHIDTLPSGWLGKVHALDVGTRRSGGDWLLYTDADVRFEPGALRRAVALGEEGFDHVALIPDIETTSLLQDVVTQTFGVALAMSLPIHEAPTDEDAFVGVGAFNLVRRDVLERTEGFEWLRMEIADDVGLGLMLQRHGARSWGGRAWETLRLQWYSSTGDMLRGLEKNLFAVMGHYSWARTIALLLTNVVMVTLPLAGLALPAPFGWPVSVALLGALVTFGVVGWRIQGSNPLALMLLPLGVALLGVALAQSALSYARHGGASWRGTVYPTDALREHQRLRL